MERVSIEKAQSAKRIFHLETLLGKKVILLGRVTKERVTLVPNLCHAKERGRTLEAQLEVLKVKDEKLRREKDKIASD